MSNPLYTTTALSRIVQGLRVPHTALLDMFFADEVVSPEEEIAFDVVADKRRLSPFVSPLVEGKIVQSKGWQTDKFKPAYIKDKRVIDPSRPIRRAVGERIGGGDLSPADRQGAIVALELKDQVEMFNMRLEVMAADALFDGKIVVDGEGYDAVEVDFGRDATLTKALLTTNRWGENGVSPFDDVQDWRRLVLSKSGERVTDIVFGAEAWELYVADPKVEKAINTDFRGGASEIEIVDNVGEGAEYQGRLGANGPRLWVYSQSYTDADGQEQEVLEDYRVVMGSRNPASTGVRYFGAIRDEEAGLQAMPFFAKSWTVEDPSARFLMLQSAPLTVPTRVNSTFSALVRDD